MGNVQSAATHSGCLYYDGPLWKPIHPNQVNPYFPLGYSPAVPFYPRLSRLPNHYHCARFLTGAYQLAQLPPDSGNEVAFAGRSNAGKSSAINTITGIGNLARTSRTPGRTQQINFFTIDPDRRLVDLPGYGYAKVPPTMQRHWQMALTRYLGERRCLRGIVLVMDARHPLRDLDEILLAGCQAVQLPVQVLLTKVDKLSRSNALQTQRAVTAALADYPQLGVQLFSATHFQGQEEARAKLDHWFGFSPLPA